MTQPRPQVVVGSTRPGRRGAAVGRWFHDLAVRHDRFDVELIDLHQAVHIPLINRAVRDDGTLHADDRLTGGAVTMLDELLRVTVV